MKKNILYWSVTLPALLVFAVSGTKDLLRQEPVLSSMHRLGYPEYMMNILGVAKVAGVLVILIPHRFYRIKEWAYAGFVFDVLGAIASHLYIGEGFGDGGSGYGTALITLMVWITSWVMFSKRFEIKITEKINTRSLSK